MSGEPKNKQELIEQARIAETQVSRAVRPGARNSEPKEQTRPNSYELVPGGIYALSSFCSDDAPPPYRNAPTHYVGGERVKKVYYWEYGDWSAVHRHYFRVRMRCTPIKNSKIALVELISTGKLAIVEVNEIQFIQKDWVSI
jgi:hypothetical protein